MNIYFKKGVEKRKIRVLIFLCRVRYLYFVAVKFYEPFQAGASVVVHHCARLFLRLSITLLFVYFTVVWWPPECARKAVQLTYHMCCMCTAGTIHRYTDQIDPRAHDTDRYGTLKIIDI